MLVALSEAFEFGFGFLKEALHRGYADRVSTLVSGCLSWVTNRLMIDAQIEFQGASESLDLNKFCCRGFEV